MKETDMPFEESARKTNSFQKEYGINPSDLEQIDRRARQIAPLALTLLGAVACTFMERYGPGSGMVIENVVRNPPQLLQKAGDIFLNVQCSIGDNITNPYCKK